MQLLMKIDPALVPKNITSVMQNHLVEAQRKDARQLSLLLYLYMGLALFQKGTRSTFRNISDDLFSLEGRGKYTVKCKLEQYLIPSFKGLGK